MSVTVVVNALLFQATWFACVIGGAQGQWQWGALGILALLGFSFWRNSLARDVALLSVLAVVGFCLDSLWAATGVLDYGAQTNYWGAVALAPVWITLLWMGVGLTTRHSLKFLADRPALGALLAGGAAVPSYLGGQRLGAVVVPEWASLGIIALAWALAFFVLFSVVDTTDRSSV